MTSDKARRRAGGKTKKKKRPDVSHEDSSALRCKVTEGDGTILNVIKTNANPRQRIIDAFCIDLHVAASHTFIQCVTQCCQEGRSQEQKVSEAESHRLKHFHRMHPAGVPSH